MTAAVAACDRDTPGRDAIAAAGSLPRPPHVAFPSARRRAWLWSEMAAIFLLLPLAMMVAIYSWRVPVWAALFPVLIGLLIILALDRTFSLRAELSVGVARRDVLSILALLGLGAVAMIVAVATFLPDQLFTLPRTRTGTWRKIITNYPFLSVTVQEFVYRTLFFHRYGPLFGNRGWLAIVLSAALFAFGHIIFWNWVAVAGTLAAGLLFAWRYERTRSYRAVWIEHTVWGWAVFTIGLGGFFFTGVVTGWKFSL